MDDDDEDDDDDVESDFSITVICDDDECVINDEYFNKDIII
jgi:hypothetical protein